MTRTAKVDTMTETGDTKIRLSPTVNRLVTATAAARGCTKKDLVNDILTNTLLDGSDLKLVLAGLANATEALHFSKQREHALEQLVADMNTVLVGVNAQFEDLNRRHDTMNEMVSRLYVRVDDMLTAAVVDTDGND